MKRVSLAFTNTQEFGRHAHISKYTSSLVAIFRYFYGSFIIDMKRPERDDIALICMAMCVCALEHSFL